MNRRNKKVETFGGTVLRLRNDPHWHGSAFEAADILWDGNDGLQTVSLFETKPASVKDAKRVGESVLEKVEALSRKEFAAPFVEPVPSELPELVIYDAIVPVKMDFRTIIERLKNGWCVGMWDET